MLRYLQVGACALLLTTAGCSTLPTGERQTGPAKEPGVAARPPVAAPAGGGQASPAGSTPAVGTVAAGSYQDRQAAELRLQLEGSGIRVLRNGESIKLILPGSVAFGVNSEQIQPGFTRPLDGLAAIIRRYDKTQVDVRGYTDSTGSFQHNQELSARRAQSVASYLISRQVAAARVHTAGYGPRYPIASNASETGRAQNRRVEIELQQR